MTNTNVIALSANNDPIRIVAEIITMVDANDMNVTRIETTTETNATIMNVTNLRSLMRSTAENGKIAKIRLNLPRNRSWTDLT